MFVLGGCFKAHAINPDSSLNGLRLEAKYQYGFVMPHSGTIRYLLMGNIQSAEISLSTRSNGRHAWENLYRYPRYGLAYNYTEFGNPEILGEAHAIFAYQDLSFYRSVSNFSLNYQVGFGIGYFTNGYHPYNNPLNLAISSRANVFISFDLIARYRVNQKNELKAALELAHYSNGKTRSPNLGLNGIFFSTSWIHALKNERKLPFAKRPIYKRHLPELIVNIGGKRDDLLNDKVYFVTTAIGDYYYMYSPRYGFGAGIDFMHDPSITIVRQSRDKLGINTEENYQFGPHLGFRIKYHKFNIVINGGYYLYAKFLKYTPFYTRVGMRYELNDKILLNLTLKAHRAIADYIEWGAGYRF